MFPVGMTELPKKMADLIPAQAVEFLDLGGSVFENRTARQFARAASSPMLHAARIHTVTYAVETTGQVK